MTGLHITVAGALGLIAKATLVLAVAHVIGWFARRGSAKTLHFLWTTTFAVLLVLPGAALLAPPWTLPVLPAWTATVGHRPPIEHQAPIEHPSQSNTRSQWVSIPSDDVKGGPAATASPSDAASQARTVAQVPIGAATSPDRADASFALTPTVVAFLIWALGCGAGLVSLGAAVIRFRGLARGATQIRDPDWIQSANALRGRLGVRRHARIMCSAQVATPMTGGPMKPVILLPASAVTSWTAELRDMVMAHELVHVRRQDALWRLVGGTVAAVYWFHPLIWIASRLAHDARERSCDEEVLALGVRPSAYARHLFSLASEIVPGPRVLASPLAHAPRVEGRIRSILKLRRPRFSRARTSAALTLMGLASLFAACATPVRVDPSANPSPRREVMRVDGPLPEDPVPAPIRAPAPATALPTTETDRDCFGRSVSSRVGGSRRPVEGSFSMLRGRDIDHVAGLLGRGVLVHAHKRRQRDVPGRDAGRKHHPRRSAGACFAGRATSPDGDQLPPQWA